MGINREPGNNSKIDAAQRKAESRTWWYVPILTPSLAMIDRLLISMLSPGAYIRWRRESNQAQKHSSRAH